MAEVVLTAWVIVKSTAKTIFRCLLSSFFIMLFLGVVHSIEPVIPALGYAAVFFGLLTLMLIVSALAGEVRDDFRYDDEIKDINDA